MAEILDYFDNISIDIEKRKYYNVNKVNAVLAGLRRYAEALVEENKGLRQELKSLRAALDERSSDDNQAKAILTEMQSLYRDTLDQAHQRADGIIREAETRSEILTQNAEQRSGVLAGQVKDCFEVLQAREEENLRILKDHLNEILNLIGTDNTAAADASEAESDSVQRMASEETAPAIWQRPIEPPSGQEDTGEDEALPDADENQLKNIELQIRRLAQEIDALESDA